MVESIDNAGNVTSYEYDQNGNQTASVDAKGNRITYAYDDLANLTKTTYPDGTFETFAYDANGNNISATDRSGLKITMKYDKLDRMTEKTYADGSKESYVYDAVGNVTETISATGAKTTYTYDSRNRNTSITDALGNVTSFEYDEQARLTARKDAAGNITSYDYDANGNIIKTTYPDGTAVISEYDARNRVVSQKNQYGYETRYSYDGADRLTAVTDAYGNRYTYGYDSNGNLVTVTDAKEQVTAYTYDAAGRVSTVRNALGKTMAYSYDEIGNITEYKDYAGIVTTYAYDDMNQLVKKTVGSESTIYTYSDTGLLTKVKDSSGTVTYGYDNYDRLISKTDARGVKLTYTYDKVGRLLAFDNGFGTTKYEYDVLDRITRVIDRNGQATVYEYDALGNRSAVRYPNGNVMTYTYDACQRLKEENIVNGNGVQLAKYSYGIGKAGERISVTEINSGVETEITYKYDKLNRLVKETIECKGNRLTNEYEYDEVGNRTKKKTTVKGDITSIADTSLDEVEVTEGTTTYTYNSLNQLITEVTDHATKTYTYDANGSLIRQTGERTVDYSYDKEMHLIKATIQKGNSVTIESYTYDYAGNRTSKTVNESDTTYYVNDTSGSLSMVVAETDKNGKEQTSFTRGDNAELLSMERGQDKWYYLSDGHGSVRILTNIAGRITDRYGYDAYGNLLEKEGDADNDFLYTGEQYNANTGLYYLRARYMNPSTGTFISMDSYQGSLEDPVSLHKYLYANANPVMYTDPSGYSSATEMAINMDCTISARVAEVYYNAVILKIGIQAIVQFKAVGVVESFAYISSEVILSIGVDGIFSGEHADMLTDKMLLEIIDSITLAYMVAGDCIALDVAHADANKTKKMVDSVALELSQKNKKDFKENCVYVLRDSKRENKVAYVGRTNQPWRRKLEHDRDPRKRTDGVKWKMYIVKDGLTVKEAKALENALICVYTIDALANARHEIAVGKIDKFNDEFARASTICRIPLEPLRKMMKGDYK